jgi:hypothetical protein
MNGHCPGTFGFAKLSVSFPVTKMASLTIHPQPLRLLLQTLSGEAEYLICQAHEESRTESLGLPVRVIFSIIHRCVKTSELVGNDKNLLKTPLLKDFLLDRFLSKL